MSRLPDLAKLSLACQPCEKPFDHWRDVSAEDEDVRKTGKANFILGQTICSICKWSLNEKTYLGD